jgi:5'-nucleotidase/UDP-sugar diphosphatase
MEGGAMHRILTVVLLAATAWGERISIIHTNDIHAQLTPYVDGTGGMAHLATALRREQAGCKGCLHLDGGDMVQGTPASTLFKGIPAFDVANTLGIDVATLGNHEFDYTADMIPKFLDTARYTIVCANVENDRGQLIVPQPYTIRMVNGVRVGVIGVVTARLPELSIREHLGPWKALPVAETVKKYVAELRSRADMIVVVGHLANPEEEEIVKTIPEVHVVVSGHDHRGLEVPKVVDGRMVVRVKARGVEYGRLDLDFDKATRKVREFTWKHTPVVPSQTPAAPDAAELVAKWEKRVTEVVDAEIGESKVALARPQVKLLIEDAMVDETGADFAYMNLGGVRADLPNGKLLARHVWNVMPFDNLIVIGKVKGSQLPPKVLNGKTVDPDREYTLAVNNFIAGNQQVELGVSGLEFPTNGRPLRDVIIDYVRKRKVLD